MVKTPLERVTLEGDYVRLVPLQREHVDPLCELALDEDLWRWTPTAIRCKDDLSAFVEEALHQWSTGDALPFTITVRETGEAAGMTRFGNVDLANRKVEIGWTWVGRPWQRTAVNTETKLLLLRHAFERLGCHRVELKTDALNTRSRSAILRLGAKEEGVLRKHVITQGGRARDSVYYSILDTEWPEVAAGLRMRLARGVAQDAAIRASDVDVSAGGQSGGARGLESPR
jgi:RimJ/RimL family protein N-acetyltransferase